MKGRAVKKIYLFEEASQKNLKSKDVSETHIRRYIHNEWIVPAQSPASRPERRKEGQGLDPGHLSGGVPPRAESRVFPLLDEEDLARAKLIRELQEVFGVNDEAIPIILHLLDQLYFLKLRNG